MNHSINIAAKRSGLTPHVIRVWERRYGAVAPVRTDTNRRQYSDEEIERLVLLKRGTDAGYKISSIAPLSTDNLVELLAKDQQTEVRESPTTPPNHHEAQTRAAPLIATCMEACRALDQRQLEETLTQAALSLGHQGMICHVVSPLAVLLGKEWESGNITAAHEHFASAIIKVFLTNISKPFTIPETSPRLVVATPSGQIHELGAIIAMAIATSAGWNVTYLGTNLPATELAGACKQENAQALALSIVYPSDDPALPGELERLHSFLGKHTPIIVGGRAATSYRTVLSKLGAFQCGSIPDLLSVLHDLRGDST